MTMVIAFNAVPPEKGGLVAAMVGVILTVGGVAGPLLSGEPEFMDLTLEGGANTLSRCHM